MNEPEHSGIRFGQMLSFFVPLGISASLVTISHVIINSTLARAPEPELVIASYALPLSILSVTEKPAVLLRQTCSALVRDRLSFRAMAVVSGYVLAALFVLGAIIGFTPVGPWLYVHLFAASPELAAPMTSVYQVLMFVTFFSGVRCLFHGIIIFNMRTKWLTIGMLIRLAGMYALSLYYVHWGTITGVSGAVIFLAGMTIEAIVSTWEGRGLLAKGMPRKREGYDVERPGQIFRFYKPLLYSSVIAIISLPAINAFLGKTSDIPLAVASFAIAANLTQLVLSFFTYVHQVVLNFYRKDARAVFRFAAAVSLLPTLLLVLLAYTGAGPWFLGEVMGVNERLLEASISVLRVFTIMTLVFPWLDYGNGLLMLRGHTKAMVWSQLANVCVTLTTLLLSAAWFPTWNGMIGALAQSLGLLAEACIVALLLRAASQAIVRGPQS